MFPRSRKSSSGGHQGDEGSDSLPLSNQGCQRFALEFQPLSSQCCQRRRGFVEAELGDAKGPNLLLKEEEEEEEEDKKKKENTNTWKEKKNRNEITKARTKKEREIKEDDENQNEDEEEEEEWERLRENLTSSKIYGEECFLSTWY